MASSTAKVSETVSNEDSLDYVLSFQRREYKFAVPINLVDAIVADFMPFMDFDKFSVGGNYYDVLSLYFDTYDWQGYYEKLDGIERRKKFRLRTYSTDPGPDDLVMAEIKEKNKDIVIKRRFPMTYKDIPTVIGHGKIGGAVGDEWRMNILRNGLRPRILVGYNRLALFARDGSDLRVTVDKEVRHSSVSSGFVPDFDSACKVTANLRGYAVLEIKGSDNMPKFASRIAKRYNLRNDAISKYCEGVMSDYKRIL